MPIVKVWSPFAKEIELVSGEEVLDMHSEMRRPGGQWIRSFFLDLLSFFLYLGSSMKHQQRISPFQLNPAGAMFLNFREGM